MGMGGTENGDESEKGWEQENHSRTPLLATMSWIGLQFFIFNFPCYV